MLTLFSTSSGTGRGLAKAIMLDGDQQVPAMISFRSFQDHVGMSAIITRFEINESVLAQVSPMIGRDIYVYVFNNAPADIVISGICFQRSCEGGVQDGLSRLRDFYAQNRATSRTTPIQIVMLPNSVFRGVLLGGSYHSLEPESQLVGFRYLLKAVGHDDV